MHHLWRSDNHVQVNETRDRVNLYSRLHSGGPYEGTVKSIGATSPDREVIVYLVLRTYVDRNIHHLWRSDNHV